MTLEIRLAPDEEARLRDRAAAAGQDVQTFIREAVFEKLDRPTFAELLAPVHEEVRRSGMGTDQVDALADQAREEYWADRRTDRNSKP
jgi:predicted DNA-binding protein